MMFPLAKRLGLMADAMVSAVVGPKARFFSRERVDEIVLLLREAERALVEVGARDRAQRVADSACCPPSSAPQADAHATDRYSLSSVGADALAPPEPLEICICAAVQFADGRIVRGHRHDSCFRTAEGWTPTPTREHVQGFITSRNRFVNGTEAMQLMARTDLFSAYTGLRFAGRPADDQLFSEDLYFDAHDHAAMLAPPRAEALAPRNEVIMTDENKSTWYGPHECSVCGVTIVKAAREDGGAEFEPPARLMRAYRRGSEAFDVDLVYPMTWKAHEHVAVWAGVSPRGATPAAPDCPPSDAPVLP